MKRVEDYRAVADAPAFLLIPASMPYNGTRLCVANGFALYHAHCAADQGQLRLTRQEPVSLSYGEARRALRLEAMEVTLYRQTFGRQERHVRYTRRQAARRLGRRCAVPVPIATEWMMRVFAERDVDPCTIDRVAHRAVAVARSWRHGNAVDWARRNYNLRVKRERKAARS